MKSNIHVGPRWSYRCSCGDELWHGDAGLCAIFQSIHAMHIFSQTEYFWINRGVVSEIVDVRKLT